MSFRNFDNRDRYYDREGNVLCGCLQFMIKDGTTVANIYDGDMVALANPQVTDILGRTKHQVFVDSDVIAYVYRYVGTGTLAEEEAAGIDTSDSSKWEMQYTVESTSIDTRSIDGTSAAGVSDIDSLRSLAVDEVPEVDGYKIVTLHGYYEAGDCEAVNYVWDSESTLNDDNGSVIQPDGVLTGRWILVQPTEHCDSRHFGIFPQDSVDAEIDHSTRITQLLSYCNTHSIKPYFNGSQAYPYFIYTSVAYNSRNTIDVSNDTQFVDKGTGNRFYGEWNGNPYFVNANTQVNSKTVRHSWHFGSYGTGTVHYIVDSTWSPVLLSNIDVVFEVSPASGSQLTDCELSSNEKITNNIVLQGMTIKTDWFADNYNWGQLSIYDCTILLDNCKDANTYVLLKNKQHEADYGDLGEQTLSNTTLLANCIAENAAFSNVTLTGNTELHNVSGTISLSGAAYGLNFIDCWLTITNNANVVMDTVQWRRGSVVFNQSLSIQILSSMHLENVEVYATFYTPGVCPEYIGCTIQQQQLNCRDVKYVDCRINANIIQYPEPYTYVEVVGEAYYMGGEYINNKFLGTAKIMLTPRGGADYSQQTIGVIGKYCNNFSDHNFVDDSNWNGVTFNLRHTSSMMYDGNCGGCPVKEVKYQYDIPYVNLWQPSEPASFRTVPDQCRDTTGLWIVNDWRSGGNQKIATALYWVFTLKDHPLNVSNLFRLKYIMRRASLDIHAEIQAFIRTDSNGFYVTTFNLHSPMLQSYVDGTDNMAYLSTHQPCRFEYVGDRLYTNDDIDEKRNSLWYTTYDYKNDPTRFNANIHYTISFYNL